MVSGEMTPSGEIIAAAQANHSPMIVTGHAQRAAWLDKTVPDPEEVRPGLWSIPIPVPDNPVRYTLCYAFYSADGVILIDPGWDADECRQSLLTGLHHGGAGLNDITGVIVTHAHADHHGLSAWLRRECGAWIGMHPAEAATLPADQQLAKVQEGPTQLERWGVPFDSRPVMDWNERAMASFRQMPRPDRTLADGELIGNGSWRLEVLATPGHTPGHICLVDREQGLLLTGDHVLPRISPNVSDDGSKGSWALEAYIASLRKLIALPEADVEVLPAHEYRFTGIRQRCTDLLQHHDARCREVLTVLAADQGITTWDIAGKLTWSRTWDSLSGYPLRSALGETSAHLEYLVQRGYLRRSGDVSRYGLVAEDAQKAMRGLPVTSSES
jgi:glyoxylase-like metal-dependent hydrolase (beta-lactamase superfamily II)